MPLTKDTSVFFRVYVDYAVAADLNAARVTWELRPDFVPTGDCTFQLQVNRDTGNPDDWVDVGTPVVNTYYALDDEHRLYGKDFNLNYRVKLYAPCGDVYISNNAQIYGNLTLRQWLLARAMIRRRLLMPWNNQRFSGYMLKRKTQGTTCPYCVDPFTGGITNSDCPYCNGTGKLIGYWKAASNIMFDLSPGATYSQRDPQLERGTMDETVRTGYFVGIPVISTEDVWVADGSDARYYVRDVTVKAEMNQVPLIVQASLRLAPLSDIIYTVDLENS